MSVLLSRTLWRISSAVVCLFSAKQTLDAIMLCPISSAVVCFEKDYTMIGSFLTRGLVMIFGYVYPAYECFKTIEKNKPEVEQLRFWCQYWILVAVLTVCERIGDTFVSWLPMYSEAKLAFYIYLWFPKTKGTTYVYDSFFKPYVAKHETQIDRNLMDLRIRAGDMSLFYCQRVMSYGQTRFFEILQYAASQSTPTPSPHQNQAQPQGPNRPKPQVEEPASPTSSTCSSQHQKEVEQDLRSSPVQSAFAPAPLIVPNSPRRLKSAPANTTQLPKIVQQSDADSSNQIALTKTTSEPPDVAGRSTKAVDKMQIEPAASLQEKANSSPPPPQETVLEEEIRVTRARLRKARSTAK